MEAPRTTHHRSAVLQPVAPRPCTVDYPFQTHALAALGLVAVPSATGVHHTGVSRRRTMMSSNFGGVPRNVGLVQSHEDLVPALAGARARLTEHLSAALKEDGALRGRCASRTLESALMATLLRKERVHPEVQERMVMFLGGKRAQETRFDRALSRAVVAGEMTEAAWIHEELLAEFNHFTATRKRLMFDVCLAVVGAIPFDEGMAPEKIKAAGQVRWVEMSLLSFKVLIAAGLKRVEVVTASERARLLGMLREGQERGVWENHTTAHLIGLLAAHEVAPGAAVVREGIGHLLGCQREDGGLASIANIDVFCTGPAAVALAWAGAKPEVLLRVGDYLAREQLRDGGWPFGSNMVQSDVDTTSYAMVFLAEIDAARYRATLERGEQYLRDMAGEDGGFPTYVRGHTSEVAMTAGAVAALAPGWERHAGLLERAVGFLLEAQQADGTFERSWSLCEANAMWRVMYALRQVPAARREKLEERIEGVKARALRFLEGAQNDDGGWGFQPGNASDTTSTAFSLLSLAMIRREIGRDAVFRRGLLHLLSRQEEDGGFSAIPDQVAPRPLMFDVPEFDDVWPLIALAGCERAR